MIGFPDAAGGDPGADLLSEIERWCAWLGERFARWAELGEEEREEVIRSVKAFLAVAPPELVAVLQKAIEH